MQARGATCVASPAVERGERFGGWCLQASILGFSRRLVGDRAGLTLLGGLFPRDRLHLFIVPSCKPAKGKEKKAHRVKQNVREMLAALIRMENRGPIERYTR